MKAEGMTRGLRELEKVSAPAWELRFGARPQGDGSTVFRVWAPRARRVEVKVLGDEPRTFTLEASGAGVFEARVPHVAAGADYFYVLDGVRERPDPVSRFQPEGVHGPSRVVEPEAFAWTDVEWKGLALKEYVVYELHTGAFTPEGTFESVIPKLAHLKALGVTAVELMPVAEFPGSRNWGYDGAHLYAPQSTYGGPFGLKKLIDACHRAGLAFVLDVVYNHLGPEGNYAGEFMPLYSESHRSPWGAGLNFDGVGAEGVRRYFIENALYWLTEFHVDALRLDAVHAIMDTSETHLLKQLAAEFHAQAEALGRSAHLIAESDLNDVRLLKPSAEEGYGIDAQWSDDFHHSLHAVLTGADRGYFMDFGRVADLAQALAEGFVYRGQHSTFRGKGHGTSGVERPGEQFVVCIQNHDQIANGYWGDRLARVVEPARQRLAASILLCGAPNVPMLFMGEEWGERAPFLFFTSHTDAELGRAVREGRMKEYDFFVRVEGETESIIGGFSDPQAEITFVQSKLDWESLEKEPHSRLLAFYRDLLALRRAHAPLSNCDKSRTRVRFDEQRRWLNVERGDETGARAILLCNLSPEARPVPLAEGAWQLALWSGDARYDADRSHTAPPERIDGARTIELAGWDAAIYLEG
jgi:maltooligosyltrehalose trehalohydrolase